MLNKKVIFIVYVLVMLPFNALAFDPFSTNDLVESGPLDKILDVERCDQNKINSPLALADVVDLALCNNPQSRSLWASARYQAALVGVSTAAYLPTLTATASVSNNQTQASAATATVMSEDEESEDAVDEDEAEEGDDKIEVECSA